MFEQKLGKLIAKLKLEFKEIIFLKIDMCLSSMFSSAMKLEFNEM